MPDNPDITIIDVRFDKHWKGSDMMIKDTVREDPNDVKSWANRYSKDRLIVLYCAWPDEGTSASVAQRLIGMGFTNIYVLKGGWNEWFKANYPVEKK